MSYLVDSDHVIAFLKGVPGALESFQVLGPAGVAISVITYAEVSEGVNARIANSRQVQGWSEFLAFVGVIPVDRVVAAEPRSSNSVPCGLGEGLPVGLQVIGNFLDEGRVLQVASAYEAASGFRNLPAEL